MTMPHIGHVGGDDEFSGFLRVLGRHDASRRQKRQRLLVNSPFDKASVIMVRVKPYAFDPGANAGEFCSIFS